MIAFCLIDCTPTMFRPFLMTCIRSTPKIVPVTPPFPSRREVPPRSVTATAWNSQPVAAVGIPASIRLSVMIPAIPAMNPANAYVLIRQIMGLMPASCSASLLPPSPWILVPNLVLFSTTHTMINTNAAAHTISGIPIIMVSVMIRYVKLGK